MSPKTWVRPEAFREAVEAAIVLTGGTAVYGVPEAFGEALAGRRARS